MSLLKKCIKEFFIKIIEKDIFSNKTFLNSVKPFLTNKSSSSYNDIVLIENGKTIFEENALVETLKGHYVNIVGKSCKSKPQSFVSHSRATDDENVINEIIQYNNDQSKYH